MIYPWMSLIQIYNNDLSFRLIYHLGWCLDAVGEGSNSWPTPYPILGTDTNPLKPDNILIHMLGTFFQCVLGAGAGGGAGS